MGAPPRPSGTAAPAGSDGQSWEGSGREASAREASAREASAREASAREGPAWVEGRAEVFVFPGPVDTPTGGFRYDRRILAELQAAGRPTRALVLDGHWPEPTAADLDRADRTLAALADGSRVVIDGLALGAMPALARRHGRRLALIGLVHHPLWLENADQPPARAGQLRRAETAALAETRQIIVTSASTAAALASMAALAVGEGDAAGNDHPPVTFDPARITVVEPGCDPFELATGSGGVGPLRLLCVATVTPRKGYRLLVDALARLAGAGVGVGAGAGAGAGGMAGGGDGRGWTLTVVGALDRDPAHVAEIRARVEALGLADRIHFVGEVAEADLSSHYSRADGLVLASRHEGYGMSLAEALMHGLPVVVTRGGAIADTVAGAAHLVGEAGAAELSDEALVAALATAIRDGLIDPDGRARLAASARRWREDRRQTGGWPDAARRFAAVLDRV